MITLAEPHSGENMWYTGADQDWADLRLGRTIENVPADAKFWMWNNYVIEADWDYGFVEVSTDGGSTWTEQKVYAEDGTEVSTTDDYADPNGRMADYGEQEVRPHRRDSHGWAHDYVDLSSYAGKTVKVRLRLATDAAFQDRGWFTDDFALTSAGAEVWSRRRRERRERLGRPRSPRSRRPPAPAGASTPAPRSRRSTTSSSGATSTASTRA